MTTTQTRTVLDALRRVGHATNATLHLEVAEALPELSLTSLHRITARLLERGEIGSLAADARTVVLDARPETHHHFVCNRCGGIVDIEVPSIALASIQEQLGTHLVDGGLVVRGTCAVCRTTRGSESSPPVAT